jgi:hypothetical protein
MSLVTERRWRAWTSGVLTHMSPYIVLVSGVAGSGKSTLADPPVERIGLVGPGFYMRITPRKSWSWSMDGHPVGNTWCVARCAVHEPTTDEADR